MTGRRAIQRDPIELIVEFANNSDKFRKLYYKDPFLYDEFMKIGASVSSGTKLSEQILNDNEIPNNVYEAYLKLPLLQFENYKKIYTIFNSNISAMKAFHLVKRYKVTRDFYDEYSYDMKNYYDRNTFNYNRVKSRLDEIENNMRSQEDIDIDNNELDKEGVLKFIDPQYYTKVTKLFRGSVSPTYETKTITYKDTKNTGMFDYLRELYNTKATELIYEDKHITNPYEYTTKYDEETGEYVYDFKYPEEFRYQKITLSETYDGSLNVDYLQTLWLKLLEKLCPKMD